jgi:hypothetical protein
VLLREFRAFAVPVEMITAGVNTNATTKTPRPSKITKKRKKVFFVLLREFRAFVVPVEMITAGVNTNATTKTHSEIRKIRRNA